MASKTTRRLSLVQKRRSLVQERREQKALRISRLGQIAGNIENARAVWRACPDLVEAPEFPKQLLRAFRAEYGSNPSGKPDSDVVDYVSSLRAS